MDQKKIEFLNAVDTVADELAGSIPVATNVITDSAKGVRRRPGIVTDGVSSGGVVDAMGISAIKRTSAGTVLAISSGDDWAIQPLYLYPGSEYTGAYPSTGPRRLYVVTPDGAGWPWATQNAGSNTWPVVFCTGKPEIVETDRICAIAGGAEVYKVDLLNKSFDKLGGNPPKSSSVTSFGSRLVLNDVENYSQVRYSAVATGIVSYAGFEDWLTSVGHGGIISAEYKPDPVVAVKNTTNELVVFGATTTQFYAKDSTYVFSPSVTLDRGIGARSSPIVADEKIAWLDDRRRIVVSDGREVTDIGVTIQPILDSLSSVSDCFSYRVFTSRSDCLVFAFPEGGLHLAYQRQTGGWGVWNSTTARGVPGPMLVSAADLASATTYAGTIDGRVGRFQSSATKDIDRVIQATVYSGFQNYDTEARKHCKGLHVVIRTGNVVPGEALVIKYRDDLGGWNTAATISLDSADANLSRTFNYFGLGVYRRRQWRFDFAGESDIVLVAAYESVRVL